MKKHKNKILFILLVIIIIFYYWVDNLGKNDSYSSDSDEIRCYYCGKVISSGGKITHGDSMYNGGVVKCQYCGKKNRIK